MIQARPYPGKQEASEGPSRGQPQDLRKKGPENIPHRTMRRNSLVYG